MTQINSLTQLTKGTPVSSSIINADFETLRLANNDIVKRFLNIINNYGLQLPEKYNTILSQIDEIESLNLFGVVGGITYDSNKLSAIRFNENLDAFKAPILLRGIQQKNHEVSIMGIDDSILTGVEEIVKSELPDAPSDLEITGVFIVDQTYLDSNPESEYSLGDRIIGLQWVDNSDGETSFEIYQSKVTCYDGLITKLSLNPSDGAYNVANPVADATFAEINLGQSFMFPLPEQMVIPEAGTPVENLTIYNLAPSDDNPLRGHDINFRMRALNLVGYSKWCQPVWQGQWDYTNPDNFIERPSSVKNVEFVGNDLVIDFHEYAASEIIPRLGYEVYVSYARSYLSGFEDFELFPYTLAYQQEGDLGTGDVQLIIEDFPIPAPVYDEITGNQLNKYTLIKVVAFNALQRSIASWADTRDRGYCETPYAPIYVTGVNNMDGLSYISLLSKDYTETLTMDTNIIIEGERIFISNDGINGILNTDRNLLVKTDKSMLEQLFIVNTGHKNQWITGDDEYIYTSSDYSRSANPNLLYKYVQSDFSSIDTTDVGSRCRCPVVKNGYVYYADYGNHLSKYSFETSSVVASVDTGHYNYYLCTDGYYLYSINSVGSGGSCVISKYDISDLSFVSSVIMDNAAAEPIYSLSLKNNTLVANKYNALYIYSTDLSLIDKIPRDSLELSQIDNLSVSSI
jgi:hypothetical protein